MNFKVTIAYKPTFNSRPVPLGHVMLSSPDGRAVIPGPVALDHKAIRAEWGTLHKLALADALRAARAALKDFLTDWKHSCRWNEETGHETVIRVQSTAIIR